MARDPLVRRLVALLEIERTALMRGDLPALARLQPKKDALAGKIDPDALAPADAQLLSRVATRNQALLDAAKLGLTAARDRIAAIRAGTPIRTYSARGDRRDITAPPPTVQRRA